MKKSINNDKELKVAVSPTTSFRPNILTTKSKRMKSLIEKSKNLENGEFLDLFNQSTNKNNAGTLTSRVDASNNTAVVSNYRIRKLTPKECIRLMGFEDKDYEAMKSIGMSNAAIYHMAGDSIVVSVLTSIFAVLTKNQDEHIDIIKKYTKGIISK